ncbi:hypothetical protein TNIN_463221 [Trichonephila inaurata madagascariensis]|uniref:Uncharacterized protein n=1 Tax=Trichonephila inaurata madagascariensis TaxID=2747483 RepID=A0A8X7CBI1_9ARAC|nr:hypothetical protein TNIN_463221 [Trichonephila inaurata madagascariensis]
MSSAPVHQKIHSRSQRRNLTISLQGGRACHQSPRLLTRQTSPRVEQQLQKEGSYKATMASSGTKEKRTGHFCCCSDLWLRLGDYADAIC